jgi:hypothetical protein
MHRVSCLSTIAIVLAACGTPSASPHPRAGAIASDTAIRAAAALITPGKVLQRISVIADDSMRGRNTPSAGLEMTARYLANQYRGWGFQPLGDSGTFIQRYRLARVRPVPGDSWLQIDDGSGPRRLPLDRWASVTGPMNGTPVTGPVKLISGAITAADIATPALTGDVVVFVPNAERASDNREVMRAIVHKAPAALIVFEDGDPVAFQAGVAAAQRDGNPRAVVDGVPTTGVLTVVAHDSLLAGMPNRPDLAAWRARSTPMIVDASSDITVSVAARSENASIATAPNVVAMMPGSDSVLKHQFVILSAHMDHLGTAGDGVGGCTAKGADSICNGADDDGSGTTGVLSIAEAVARLKGHTRRSIILLNVSGEEKGLLGSDWFTAHPPVPLDHVVADINMDMIGRNNPDSIVVIGKQHSDLGTTLAAVQAAHPELHLIAADDIWPKESFYSRSDHFNFARKGVPVLFFFDGIHPQYHQPDDEVRLIDTSKLARVAQLAFYLGITVADTMPRPRWNPESYQKIVVDQQIP